MKKFFDARREMVSSGPASGAGAGGGAVSGAFIGRVFSIGRYQVTVEETVAEGELFIDTNCMVFTANVCINKWWRDVSDSKRLASLLSLMRRQNICWPHEVKCAGSAEEGYTLILNATVIVLEITYLWCC